jgi:hypothetical protein
MGKSRDLAGLEFITQSASASAATATATTLFTLPSNNFATYLVTAGLVAGDPGNYHEVAIISQQGGTLQATVLVNATLTTISVSGLNIQVTQASGLTQTVQARLTCLNRE